MHIGHISGRVQYTMMVLEAAILAYAADSRRERLECTLNRRFKAQYTVC